MFSALHHHLPLSLLLPRPCMESDSYMLLRWCDAWSPTSASLHISRVFHIGPLSYRLDAYKLVSSYSPSHKCESEHFHPMRGVRLPHGTYFQDLNVLLLHVCPLGCLFNQTSQFSSQRCLPRRLRALYRLFICAYIISFNRICCSGYNFA